MSPDPPDAEAGDEEYTADALERQLEQFKRQLVETIEQKDAEIERLKAELATEREQHDQQEQFEQLQDDIEELQENYISVYAVETVLAKQGVSRETIDDVIEAARVLEDNAEANIDS